VPEDSVQKLAEKLSKQRDIEIDYRVVKGANHFFSERLDKLQQHGEDYVATVLKTGGKVSARERQRTPVR
jgi:alpha/beta superfamily hydrolase